MKLSKWFKVAAHQWEGRLGSMSHRQLLDKADEVAQLEADYKNILEHESYLADENKSLLEANAFLQAEVERLTSMTYCAFCGEEFDLSANDATDAVEAHIHDCEKHPLFAITEYMRMKEPAREMLKKLTRDKRKLEAENERWQEKVEICKMVILASPEARRLVRTILVEHDKKALEGGDDV